MNAYSDDDSYSDYDEVKQYNSDPLCNNVNFASSDVTYLTTDENLVSNKYKECYENNALERGAV